MLSKKQLDEARRLLESAHNPVFFFDNDTDGLCSFLLLQRFLGKGKGVPIKTPELGVEYFPRIREFDSDFVFILDKPLVSDEFLKEVLEHNLPIVWIDHHKIDGDKIPNFVNYYNPSLEKNFLL